MVSGPDFPGGQGAGRGVVGRASGEEIEGAAAQKAGESRTNFRKKTAVAAEIAQFGIDVRGRVRVSEE